MILDMLPWLHWSRPHWLWALLLLPLVIAISLWRGRRPRGWERDVDAHLLPHLLVPGGGRARRGTAALVLGLALAVLALAGPGWQQQAQPLWKTQSPLVVVLDLSSRITATDLPPSRLLQARAKLASLLRLREGGQLGLVVYAGDAFTVAPLTDDMANVGLYLDALSPQVMPADGQRTDRALDWATQLLQRSGARSGRILLVTDRADAMAVTAAGQAQAQGMTVSVLGLGTINGAAYRDASGQIATASLDESTLQALASSGGGRYQRLSADDSDLRALGLLRADDGHARQEQGTSRSWQDQGYWLLPPLMVLALLAFRRRSSLMAVLLAVTLLPAWAPPAAARPAATAPASQAPPDTQGTLWQRADQRRAARMEQGVQAYRAGDFAAAQRQFQGVDSDEGWYNLGNARARLGDLDGAIQAYDRALQLHPGMEDALANRAVVQAARDRRGQGGQGQKQGQQGRDKAEGKGAQGTGGRSPADAQDAQARAGQGAGQGEQAQPARRPQPASGEPPAGAQQQGQSPADAAADPRAQQRADAEQRQRMQQAMQQDKQQGDSAAPARRSDGSTPRQREQQQAVEAWMRRVPDEPGDLLRAKFQLEEQRRKREGR